MDGPFCVDCRHYHVAATREPYCRRPLRRNPVTGKMELAMEKCRSERDRRGRCGPEGRFFEPKNK
jgi:hypothetical protein